MKRFFAPPEQISSSRIVLTSDETRHLHDVMRLRTGDEVYVFDGVGHEYVCGVGSITKTAAELEILGSVPPASPESPFDLTMAVAVLKGDKFDLIVQKLVELGAKKIIPLITTRTEADPKGVAKRISRWQRIGLEATKQCGRATLTEISGPCRLDEAVSGAHSSQIIMFAERDGSAFGSVRRSDAFTAIVGPEGGWDDQELQMARTRGVKIVTFGGRTLRAETATISIAAVLQHRFGDLN